VPVEWNKIRTWNGSQETAFEELICQLARYENVLMGSRFIRKGTPDAGVECFWVLPSEKELGWQAKFFTSSPTSKQWGQVDSSVKTALDKHPNLKHYTVCMAVDRADARQEDQTSFLQQWESRVTKWEGWANEKSMQVQFKYWGTHEIAVRLAREEHRGRNYFWFNAELFTPNWFKDHLAETLPAVGPRYTPELNVELPISSLFDSLSRSSIFYERYQKSYGDIGKAWSEFKSPTLKQDTSEAYDSLNQQIVQVIKAAKVHDGPGMGRIDWCNLRDLARATLKLTSELSSYTHDLEKDVSQIEGDEKAKKEDQFSGHNPYETARYYLRRLDQKIYAFIELTKSNDAKLANDPKMLLTSSAGLGKTHLLCDAASNHIESEAPAVLLLGNRFNLDEPWGQILRMLGLSCNRDEFLGALEAAAQLTGKRAILLIDALNEGPARNIWESYLPSMLECIARYPWIGLVVSVRDTYEELIFPEGVIPSDLTRIVHYGFAGHEYKAAKQFFGFYGIELPTTPILAPEFQSPLFLRTFCKGLHNQSLTKIPPGFSGITSIFNFFLDSIDLKLSKPALLDYDPRDHLVNKAIQELALWMAKEDKYGIPRSEARNICDRILPNRGFEKSLFRNLISEGVLFETIQYIGDGRHQDLVAFSYERLKDHLIVKALLEQRETQENPRDLFTGDGSLGNLFADRMACLRNKGLLEALAIQGPETLQTELFELLSGLKDDHSVCEAFIESLIWRDPKTISDKCLEYINNTLWPDGYYKSNLLDVWLTIAPNPGHPYNADFLHKILIAREMAVRDSWWSIYLFHGYDEERSSIVSLLDWAWSSESKTHISDESIRLAGKALIWFLTTSHRFLRDRATKALVNLFTDQIHVLCQVIPDFSEVNDLYVLERLYAVAYGCALRSNDLEAKKTLAQLIYDLVFKDGTPPCHILLRDYARGVIEVALKDGLQLNDFEAEKIRPPYKSEWPLEIPSEEEIKEIGKRSPEMPDEERSLHTLYNSVIGYGDFSRYILGSDMRGLYWTERRLEIPPKPTPKQQYEAFIDSLTVRQTKAWDRYLETRQKAEFYGSLEESEKSDIDGHKFNDDDLAAVLEHFEQAFRKTIKKKKTAMFNEVVIPYLKAPPGERDLPAYPVRYAQRWIMKRVLDLGWSVELFGVFDRRVSPHGRSSRKPERMGKKYQWIAWHEFLAHAADNLEYRERSWDDGADTYNGPWQIYLRDIDPSCVINSTSDNQWGSHSPSWWAPVKFDAWHDEQDDILWRRSLPLLPSIEKLPIVTDPNTGREWLVLDCFYHWIEPKPPEQSDYEYSQREIWIKLHSFLVKADDEKRLCKWTRNHNLVWNHIPESQGWSGVFMGEYFWAPAFGHLNTPYHHHDGWTKGRENELPCEVLVTVDEYLQEDAGYDCSIENSISMHMPADWIADSMGLSWRGVEGAFFNESGELVAQDPSIRQAGPRCLLMDKAIFCDFFERENYRLVWTMTGEKDILSSNTGDWPGRMEMSGHMRLEEGNLSGEAKAYWSTAGPKQTELGKIFKL
jgi:hypothetical protein